MNTAHFPREPRWAASPSTARTSGPPAATSSMPSIRHGKLQRSLDVPAHAGTAFDGRHLYQIAESRIQKVDPDTGKVLSTIPAPGNGGDSGLAWAEGSLWVGEYRARKIHQVDPATGKVLRTIESNRFVTGVTWLGNELWHATWEGDESELRRVDPKIRRSAGESRTTRRASTCRGWSRMAKILFSAGAAARARCEP